MDVERLIFRHIISPTFTWVTQCSFPHHDTVQGVHKPQSQTSLQTYPLFYIVRGPINCYISILRIFDCLAFYYRYPSYVAREHTIKWFKLQHRRFADKLAVDVFGPKAQTTVLVYSAIMFLVFLHY